MTVKKWPLEAGLLFPVQAHESEYVWTDVALGKEKKINKTMAVLDLQIFISTVTAECDINIATFL